MDAVDLVNGEKHVFEIDYSLENRLLPLLLEFFTSIQTS